jgi:UPF0755 protein
MKRAGVILTVIVSLLALACGFGGATAALYITQPAIASSHNTIQFSVKAGDTTASVAQRLQAQGIIRNAEVFRLWARYRHLDTGIQTGIYKLSPSMSMDAIIKKLQRGQPDQQLITVLDGWRITQFPQAFTSLPNFNAKNFLQIAKTGKFMDGTTVSSKYWYVMPLQHNAMYALEGYLFPDTYYFDTSADETKVITTLLDQLGEKLCPGPSGQPDAYVLDKAQCTAHAVKVGQDNTDIFTAMEKQYATKDPALALYRTLTIASIVEREEGSRPQDIPGVASVYYNRYLASEGKVPSDVGLLMQADPTTQYARDSENPPKDGKWWQPIDGAAPASIAPKNAYNTYTQQGLPPGPIAASVWLAIKSSADPAPSPYFYFINGKCDHKTYFAKTNDEQLANEAKYITQAKC